MSLTSEQREKLLEVVDRAWLGEDPYFTARDGSLFIPNSQDQADFIKSPAPMVAIFGGRGSGKTGSGAQKAIRKLSQGKSGMIIHPDFQQLKISTWPEFKKWIPWHHVVKKDQRMAAPEWEPSIPWSVHFDNGHYVHLKGVKDPDSARGPNINWLWYDEGGQDKKGEAFSTAMGGVRIGDDAQAWVTSTPRGIKHWLYELFVLKMVSPEAILVYEELGLKVSDMVDFYRASIHDNKKNLSVNFYATMTSRYTGKMAEQELEGLFVEISEGVVLDEFSPENIAQIEPVPGHPIELAFDDGYIDPRVILFIQKFPDRVLIFDEYYKSRELSERGVKTVAEYINNWPWPVDDANMEILKLAAKQLAQDMAEDEAGPKVITEYQRAFAGQVKTNRELIEAYIKMGAVARDDDTVKAKMVHYPIDMTVGSPEANELKQHFRVADMRVRTRQSQIVRDRLPKMRHLILDANDYRALIVHPRCKKLIGEITDTWRYPDGTTRKDNENPQDGDDHGCEALAHWVFVRT